MDGPLGNHFCYQLSCWTRYEDKYCGEIILSRSLSFAGRILDNLENKHARCNTRSSRLLTIQSKPKFRNVVYADYLDRSKFRRNL